eukprot:TRINITY_DN68558_c0_g1_i1.p1 TRINITY_DN68558_c0_g1~~TRINITY_DN68558_c0_g1_i1.p1  ORF type:complete len:113 (+),score=27.02 TRINITY_DN68558_c0_g1_i1:34-339(+)
MVMRPQQAQRLRDQKRQRKSPSISKGDLFDSVPLETALCNFLVKHGLMHYANIFQYYGLTLAVLREIGVDHYAVMGVPPSVQFYIKQCLGDASEAGFPAAL